MTRHQTYLEFLGTYFKGSRKEFRKLVKDDYNWVRFMWSHHMIVLYKSGCITVKQYTTWKPPFKKRRN